MNETPKKASIAILGIKGVPGTHGVETVVDSLIPHLAGAGYDVTVFGYASYAEPTDDYNGAAVRVVEGCRRKNLEMISHMWRASLAVRREGFDIVHIHSTDPCLLAWLPRPRRGLVATSHGQAYLREKWSRGAKAMSRLAERFFIRCPDVRTSVSKPLAEYYNGRYGDRVRYIPNGIVMRERPPADWLRRHGLEPGGYLFCSVGRIERTKGLTTLIEAYRRLGTDLPLAIAGGGPATDEAYFEELKAARPEGVRFVGFLTGQEYYALYAHARAFVFPSEYEAMSIALLEGLALGVPAVYSDIPENEVVAGGVASPFAVSDAESLATALRRLLADPDGAAATAKRALDRVRRRHSWEAIARQYGEIYEELMRRRT
ncbi:MAG: glycosyltransferase family 4 protein [Candidatus Krumholzibacteriota bacterium]|nr:glycosyltransferase family 4 protein [Candidatus Krumholzibacteriota bacterium]